MKLLIVRGRHCLDSGDKQGRKRWIHVHMTELVVIRNTDLSGSGKWNKKRIINLCFCMYEQTIQDTLSKKEKWGHLDYTTSISH